MRRTRKPKHFFSKKRRIFDLYRFNKVRRTVSMKKLNLNFIVNSVIFLLFLPIVSTGLLLYLFPRRIGDITALGLSRHEWGDIHLVISLLFLIFIGIHLVIHYNWAKAVTRRFLKIGIKPLVISTLILFILTFATPYLITKDLPASNTKGNRSGGWDNTTERKGDGTGGEMGKRNGRRID